MTIFEVKIDKNQNKIDANFYPEQALKHNTKMINCKFNERWRGGGGLNLNIYL